MWHPATSKIYCVNVNVLKLNEIQMKECWTNLLKTLPKEFQCVFFSPVVLGRGKFPWLPHKSIAPPNTPALGWAASTPQRKSWHGGSAAGESDWHVVCPRGLK